MLVKLAPQFIEAASFLAKASIVGFAVALQVIDLFLQQKHKGSQGIQLSLHCNGNE
jgi:hypothetical protein